MEGDLPGGRSGDIKTLAGVGSSGGAASDGGTAGTDQLSEDYWIDLWAYGTSPVGLGLSERRFWSLTRREYYALHRVKVMDAGGEDPYATGTTEDGKVVRLPKGWPRQSLADKKTALRAALEVAAAAAQARANQRVPPGRAQAVTNG